MEKILRIEDEGFVKDGYNFEGYQIITDKQIIKIGISSGRSCCEQTGYFMSEDNIDNFINAELLEIKLSDTCLASKKLEDNYYEGGLMFVDFITDKGTLQFTVYNSHNGYYGHEAVVISEQLNHKETL